LGAARIVGIQPLTDGLRNANFEIELSTGRAVVARLYEHDATICQKEVDLLRMLCPSVPVPTVLHAEPGGTSELPPFLVMEWVEGVTLQALKRRGDHEAMAQAAFSVGETLATIGHLCFAHAGWLGPGPRVQAPLLEGPDPTPRFIDLCLAAANLQRRMAAELRERTSAFVWSWKSALAELDAQALLVHGDFGKRNVLVREERGRWRVAAILDWEFAVASSPLIDLGHFIRYERASRPLAEPHFSAGYLAGGGTVVEDWKPLARVVDLAALCESLTHNGLPELVVGEVVELIRATVEGREPDFSLSKEQHGNAGDHQCASP
jgi:aminoglycoside phosphotransferase (APT) family kinase protein